MLNRLKRQGQPDHERLRDEIIGFVLARRPPPASLVAAAQEAKNKAAAAGQLTSHANDAAAPAAPAPIPAPILAPQPEPVGPAAQPAQAEVGAGPDFDWRMRELKRCAAVRGYIAEVGVTATTRQRLQAYAVELHGLAQRHGSAVVAKIALLLGALVETETRAVFSTVETYLTCVRAVLRADVRTLEDPLGQAILGELCDLAASDGRAPAA